MHDFRSHADLGLVGQAKLPTRRQTSANFRITGERGFSYANVLLMLMYFWVGGGMATNDEACAFLFNIWRVHGGRSSLSSQRGLCDTQFFTWSCVVISDCDFNSNRTLRPLL